MARFHPGVPLNARAVPKPYFMGIIAYGPKACNGIFNPASEKKTWAFLPTPPDYRRDFRLLKSFSIPLFQSALIGALRRTLQTASPTV